MAGTCHIGLQKRTFVYNHESYLATLSQAPKPIKSDSTSSSSTTTSHLLLHIPAPATQARIAAATVLYRLVVVVSFYPQQPCSNRSSVLGSAAGAGLEQHNSSGCGAPCSAEARCCTANTGTETTTWHGTRSTRWAGQRAQWVSQTAVLGSRACSPLVTRTWQRI